MAIESTYRELLLEEFIKAQLEAGNNLSGAEIEAVVESLIDSLDLSVPQFDASSYYVERLSSSSAATFNTTLENIRQDLRVLYRDMIKLTSSSTESIERWKLEATQLEKQLIDLEERIENLLILTQDTEGNQAVIIDNFSDTAKIDLSLTTTEVDIECQAIEMATNTSEAITRIFLNNLDLRRDVSFKIRTTRNFNGREDSVETDLTDIFRQESQTWWSSVRMSKAQPVTCELLVQLDRNEPIRLSRIFIDLLHSSESSPLYITPLYSIDNQNYSQLPTNTFSLKAKTRAVFSFSEIEARWIKFLITKRAPDPSSSLTDFSYQFGFKAIHFFQQEFVSGNENKQQFFSKPLFAINQNGAVVEFEKLTLETCERVETNTEINYFVTASDTLADLQNPVDGGTFDKDTATWFPISPLNRAVPEHPNILDIGDIDDIVIGDTETVQISYDGSQIEVDDDKVNPAESFQLLSLNGNTIQNNAITAASVRYTFANENDRILNYQIKDTTYTGTTSGDPLSINETTIELFRNVGEQGITPGDITKQVRNIQKGWRFVDPFYSCVVEITNPEGLEIDVGDQPITIDDVRYTNKISNTVLTGKTSTQSGIHRIKIHKNNWKEVTPNLSTLELLKAADPLYPFNHKLLIEGYQYNALYPNTSEKIYTGVDLFAEILMRQASPFDIANNLKADNYDYFALDRDAPNTHTGDGGTNSPTRVFVLKVNEENPDFVNERFTIRFNRINQLQKYLRLRADMITEDGQISPALHSYKIKLG